MSKFITTGVAEFHALARQNKEKYAQAEPFPHIAFDDFFQAEALHEVLAEFPALQSKDSMRYDNHNEKKLASNGEYLFGEKTKLFMHFLNSQPFLEFLEILTGVENLIPDPQYSGGGYHQIMPGGFLKVHADFNKHPVYSLDRRLNALVYLNEDWEESYGGALELWDKDMKHSVEKIFPFFNRLVVFSTNDFTFHGHPEPLKCPEGRSRKSLALYYYTNGRPKEEINIGLEEHSTLFKQRPNSDDKAIINPLPNKNFLKRSVLAVTPPIIVGAAKKILGRK